MTPALTIFFALPQYKAFIEGQNALPACLLLVPFVSLYQHHNHIHNKLPSPQTRKIPNSQS